MMLSRASRDTRGIRARRVLRVTSRPVSNWAEFIISRILGLFTFRNGGKNENKQVGWIGPARSQCCIYDGMRAAFEKRGVVSDFVEHGSAVLADRGERVQSGGGAVPCNREGCWARELRSASGAC